MSTEIKTAEINIGFYRSENAFRMLEKAVASLKITAPIVSVKKAIPGAPGCYVIKYEPDYNVICEEAEKFIVENPDNKNLNYWNWKRR